MATPDGKAESYVMSEGEGLGGARLFRCRECHMGWQVGGMFGGGERHRLGCSHGRPISPAPDLSALWALVDHWIREAAGSRDHDEHMLLTQCADELRKLLPPRAEEQQP